MSLRRQLPRRALTGCLAATLLSLVTGSASPREAFAQPPLSLLVIVSPTAPVREIDAPSLASIFRGNTRTWNGGTPIVPFNLPAGNPLRTEFERVVLKMTPEEVAKYWIDRRVRGEGLPPRQLPSPDLVVRMVVAMEGSVGYVPDTTSTEKVHVVARIREGRIWPP